MPRRADLHCHSRFSNKPSEAILGALRCPECYSEPQQVYDQALARGMDFVTLTDHDTIDGALALRDARAASGRSNILIGEELTCFFPEDGCKIHVLAWGITPEDHLALQAAARDVYQVARYIAANRIAHAVAHPLYRQNDKLERWHVERLLLLFKGFECLNGAHSPLHCDAFEPLLQWLSRDQIDKLAAQHNLAPLWPVPWIKARTGGSDDHGLLNVGRTWTEFPPDADTPEKVLQCLREGTCRPGGEAGSSAKLAHTFYSVAVRYYSRHIHPAGVQPNLTTAILQAIVGEAAPPSQLRLARAALRSRMAQFFRVVTHPFRMPRETTDGTTLLKRLFLGSFRKHLDDRPDLRVSMGQGLPPLAQHQAMVQLVNTVNREVTAGLADAIAQSIDDASFTGLFEAISAILAQQFVLLPYYFALFHQNRERRHLREMTPPGLRSRPPEMLRIADFTDTLDDVNGVGRFLKDIGTQARRQQRTFIVHTCSPEARHQAPWRKNFAPLLAMPMPGYPQLSLALPPVLEILQWVDQQQFDAIHVTTPGPMGFCGLLAAWMLRVPAIGTFHTDFAACAEQVLGDHRITAGLGAWQQWFYARLAKVFARSRANEMVLRQMGIASQRIEVLSPGVDTQTFRPDRRDPLIWSSLGVAQPLRLLYAGRLSAEKNLDLLAESFAHVAARRSDVALVFAGEGPAEPALRRKLAGLPVYFLGALDDDRLATLYASADLLVFPSAHETLGQVVLEAQASGLPVIVSSIGGPRELVEPGVTGLVLPPGDANAWTQAIVQLLEDADARVKMSRAAPAHAQKYALSRTFDQFWSAHIEPPEDPADDEGQPQRPEDTRSQRQG